MFNVSQLLVSSEGHSKINLKIDLGGRKCELLVAWENYSTVKSFELFGQG